MGLNVVFPKELTDEETMLQSKYQKLKRKKRALQKFKTPRPEPEQSPVKTSKGPKLEARDAREVAKKLLKSGAIAPIPKPIQKTEKEGFKRPRGLERKLTGSERTVTERIVQGYHPFAPAPETEESSSTTRPKIKNLYDSFVSGTEEENESETDSKKDVKVAEKPKQGQTVFVSGHKISEDILKKAFSRFSKILNISMEVDKHRGFVTFEDASATQKAISEMDGAMVSGGQIRVSMARHQPIVSAPTETNSVWGSIASNNSQKGSHKDKRDVVKYDDAIFDP